MPLDPDLLQHLRSLRQRELVGSSKPGAMGALGDDDHRASLTQVHDDLRTVLGRIDAAEAGMRAVLHAWALDPARGGAHLLDAEGDSADDLHETPSLPTGELRPHAEAQELPDTVPADDLRPAPPQSPC